VWRFGQGKNIRIGKKDRAKKRAAGWDRDKSAYWLPNASAISSPPPPTFEGEIATSVIALSGRLIATAPPEPGHRPPAPAAPFDRPAE
jgi:hypothetical protein